MEICSTLDFLVGTWTVDREIEDHRSQTRGSFHGTATVVAADPGQPPGERRAHYDEAGQLRFGTHSGPASRRLEYVSGDGDPVQVRFADGRPFIDLDLRSGTWQAVHQCGADRYELTTIVCSPGVVQEHWHVHGPAKDYDAVTTLTRVTGGAAGHPPVDNTARDHLRAGRAGGACRAAHLTLDGPDEAVEKLTAWRA